MAVNCDVDCKDGCILGNDCPNLKYTVEASKFITDTPLDDLLAMADEAVRRKMMERAAQPPKWVLPED